MNERAIANGGHAPVRPRVLVVDDEPANLDLLERTLRSKYEVLRADGAEEGLQLLEREHDVAIILCDYLMPVMNGAQFLVEAIKHCPRAMRVIITGYADADGIIEAVNRGQIHYFVKKPWSHQELDRTMDHLLAMYHLERENRSLVDELGRTNKDLQAKERLLAQSLDERGNELLRLNAELERANRELELLAHRDALTGLYNQHAFQERVREELSRARRYGKPMSLLLVEVAGQDRGVRRPLEDASFQKIGELMRGAAGTTRNRGSDVAARWSADRFALLLPETGKEGSRIKADRLAEAIRALQPPSGGAISVSTGVASFPEDGEEADSVSAVAEHELASARSSAGAPIADTARSPKPHLTTVDPTPIGVRAGSSSPPEPEFPTHHERINDICATLERDRALGSLYVDLSRLRRVEVEYGVAQHTELLNQVGQRLGTLQGAGDEPDLLCRVDDGDAFVWFLPQRRPGGRPAESLEKLAMRVQEAIDQALAPVVFDLIHDHPRVAVGYARVLHNPLIRSERLVSKLLSEAKESAAIVRRRQAQLDKNLLQEIILGDGLTPLYQPIVDLGSGEVFGFEALTRGPRRTSLEAPMALFTVAEEVNLLLELDRACFRGAMHGAVGLDPEHRLFVNLLPLSFYDSSFIQKELMALLASAKLSPSNIIFEITERLAIENFASFRRALAGYTDMGFGVAIDDVGTKHSNLEAVMALRPQYVKMSDVLTRGASKSTVKREMLRSLGRISEAIGAIMIAEGIETTDDLVVLKDLGIRYGQGYLLARPGSPFPRISAGARRTMRALAERRRNVTGN